MENNKMNAFACFILVKVKIFKFVIPLYRRRQQFAAECLPNSADVVCVDRMHRRLFAQCLWFQLYKTDSPVCVGERRKKYAIAMLKPYLVNVKSKFRIHTCPSESTCHEVRHGVHSKWPQGSIRMSLSFSAHILHNWNVLPANVIEQSLNFAHWSHSKWPATYPFRNKVRTALEWR